MVPTQPSKTHEPESPQILNSAPVEAAALSIGFAVIVSRMLGLVREMILARYFGAGRYTDAFNVAYRIPNLLRDLFAEGALSAAFIPTFIKTMTQNGKASAWLLTNKVISGLLVLLGAITLIFLFGARGFVYLLASGYAAVPEKFELTVQLTQIMAPFLLCVSLASVGMGLLNACGSFFVPAMASSAFNICCILAGIFLSPVMPYWGLSPIVSMAIGATLGGASQFLVMMPPAYSAGFRFRFVLDFSDPDLRQIARLMVPAIIGLSATQINIVVDSQIASIYGDGPVSWLNYGFRLMQFPIGIFGIAIATSTTAAVAHYAARNAMDQLNRTIDSSLKLAACLTFPATVGLIVFRREIVKLLYEGGQFLPIHSDKTSQVVLLYALGLFSYSAVKILVPAFYSLQDARTPMYTSLITVAAKVALNFVLIIPLGFLGLALATSFASWLNFGLLLKHLRSRTCIVLDKSDLQAYLRIALAALAMGLLASVAFRIMGPAFSSSSVMAQNCRLGLSIIVGCASLFPLYRLFRVDEGKEMARILSRAMRRAI